jgi:hypothetical protein
MMLTPLTVLVVTLYTNVGALSDRVLQADRFRLLHAEIVTLLPDRAANCVALASQFEEAV